jgi:hypothetical protein
MTGIHNRPHDNDCYDGFVEWLRKQGVYFEYVRWDEYRDRGEDVVVTMMQDPVGSRKAGAVPARALNHPSSMNRCVRSECYPVWRAEGIRCPGDPKRFRREDVTYPCLLKVIGKQMGRAFRLRNPRDLDHVVFDCATFDEDKFWIVPFVDTKFPDGYFRLHRYLVAGEEAIPVVLAKTRSWCSKASHMRTVARGWRDEDWDSLAREFEEFQRSAAPPQVTRAVASLGLDFGLVDATLTPQGPVVWEVNPYMNLRDAEAAGKPERWWPFFASYLTGRGFPRREITGLEYITRIREFRGYKPNWRDRTRV